jgi:Lysophospholipase L1 and related esterases
MADIEKIREFYRARKKLQRRKLALTAAAAVFFTLFLGVAVMCAVMLTLNRAPEVDHPGTAAPIETGQPDQTSPPETTAQTTAETADQTDAQTTAADSESKTTETDAPTPTDYDYSKPVPESAAVEQSYFDDALFVGDSRTEGFRLYAGLNNAAYYATKGLSTATAFTEPFIDPTDNMSIPDGAITDADGKLTVAQALEYSSGYGKIYIMFGINELGWPNIDAFIDKYSSLVELARKYHPSAVIYVQLILPVSKSKSDSDKIYNNDRIALFNGRIADMCADERVYCIDAPKSVAGPDGTLPEDAGVDGVHMKRVYCEKWRDYLFTHTIKDQ